MPSRSRECAAQAMQDAETLNHFGFGLEMDSMPVAPTHEDIYRPYPRPVQARGATPIRLPEALHFAGIEPNARGGVAVAHHGIDHTAEPALEPAIIGQHEAALGPVEEGGTQSAQPDAPQQRLPSN